jgi:hypothetical protein
LDIDFEKNIGVPSTAAYNIGEALTNIYVAKLRYRRGEILSAYNFMTFAVTNVMAALSKTLTAQALFVDKFDKTRRFEQNFPEEARILQEIFGHLSNFERQTELLLKVIERHFVVSTALKNAIERV